MKKKKNQHCISSSSIAWTMSASPGLQWGEGHGRRGQARPGQGINQVQFGASNFCQGEISMHHHWQHDLEAHSKWQADSGRRWRPLSRATGRSPPTDCSAVLQGLNFPVCRGVSWHVRTSILFKLTIWPDTDDRIWLCIMWIQCEKLNWWGQHLFTVKTVESSL